MRDFLIVGGGPAGALSAYLLSKKGYKVTLFEKEKKSIRKVCGEYLCPAGATLLTKHFPELNKYLPVEGMKLVSPKFKFGNSYFPKDYLGLSLKRGEFDDFLLSKAKESGAEILNGAWAKEFINHKDFWEVMTGDGSSFKGKILIGADGRRSVVVRSLFPEIKTSSKRIALHCYLKRRKKNNRLGELHVFNDGSYSAIDPVEDFESNFSIVCNNDLVKKIGRPNEVINFYINKSPILKNDYGLIDEGVKVHTTFPITSPYIKHKISNLVLLGDAGGFIDPLTGEGIYKALWDATTFSEMVGKSLKSSIKSFNFKKRREFRQKSNLNKIFQIIISSPFLSELLGSYLLKKQFRLDTFIGIIGNVFAPLEGLRQLIRGRA